MLSSVIASMASIGHVELFCLDTARTRDQLVAAFDFAVTTEQPGGFVWLQLGSEEILLRPSIGPPPHSSSYQESGMAIVIYTDDLEAAHNRALRAGMTIGLHDGDPCCPTFQDVDGHWFQVVEHKSA